MTHPIFHISSKSAAVSIPANVMPPRKGTAKKAKAKTQSGLRTNIPALNDVALVATIAASLMPRMTIKKVEEDTGPVTMRRRLEWERNPLSYEIHKNDGSSLLDVLMDEAIHRARLLLARVAGEESPSRLLWAKITQPDPALQKVIDRIMVRTAERPDPIPVPEFLQLMFPRSNDELRERYWRSYQAWKLENSIRAADDREVTVVWERDAKLADQKNPDVVIRPGSSLMDPIDVRAAYHYCTEFYGYYRSVADKIRAEKFRKSGRKGGQKAQRNNAR